MNGFQRWYESSQAAHCAEVDEVEFRGVLCLMNEKLRWHAHVTKKVGCSIVGESAALPDPFALKDSVVWRGVQMLFDSVFEPCRRGYAGRGVFVDMDALIESLGVLTADATADPPNDGGLVGDGARIFVSLARMAKLLQVFFIGRQFGHVGAASVNEMDRGHG